MSKTAPRTILLKGRGYRKEKIAGGTIKPGHLVMLNSSDQFVVHPTATRRAVPMFAVEAEHLGNPAQLSGDIDTAYSANDFVQAEILSSGCEVQARLAAAAAAVVIGDMLESAGDGTLRKVADFTDAELDSTQPNSIAMALEAVNNSGGGTEVFIKVVIV